MPRRAWHLRGRQGRRGRAAGIVTRMCRDAAGGSVARGFCVPRDRARPPEDLSEGGAAPTLVAEHLAPEVEAPINPRRAFDFWPPCRRPFILKSVQVSSPCTLVMRVTGSLGRASEPLQDWPRTANNVLRSHWTKVSAVKAKGSAAQQKELVRPKDTTPLPLWQGAFQAICF